MIQWVMADWMCFYIVLWSTVELCSQHYLVLSQAVLCQQHCVVGEKSFNIHWGSREIEVQSWGKTTTEQDWPPQCHSCPCECRGAILQLTFGYKSMYWGGASMTVVCLYRKALSFELVFGYVVCGHAAVPKQNWATIQHNWLDGWVPSLFVWGWMYGKRKIVHVPE